MDAADKDIINVNFRLTRRQLAALGYVALFASGLFIGFVLHNQVASYFVR